jgi:chromosome segregation ATPase
MDFQEELERERARRIELERELEFWLKGAMEKLPPDKLALAVRDQQVQALTYHLLKSRQRIDELRKTLSDKESDLKSAVNNIKSLEAELESKEASIERINRKLDDLKELALKIEREQEKQKLAQPEIQAIATTQSYAKTPVKLKGEAPRNITPASLKDFIQLMQRIKRIKLLDAGILLDTDPKTIKSWALKISGKGFIKIEGKGDKAQLYATEKLLKKK